MICFHLKDFLQQIRIYLHIVGRHRQCNYYLKFTASVFWTKEGSQMLMFPDNSYGHIYVTSLGTLQIRGVQKEDAGYFVCSALSVAGSETIRAFLQVIYQQ